MHQLDLFSDICYSGYRLVMDTPQFIGYISGLNRSKLLYAIVGSLLASVFLFNSSSTLAQRVGNSKEQSASQTTTISEADASKAKQAEIELEAWRSKKMVEKAPVEKEEVEKPAKQLHQPPVKQKGALKPADGEVASQKSSAREEDKFKLYFLDDENTERKDKQKFMEELARQFPEGVEQRITDGNRQIVRRVIVIGDKGFEYLKVTHSWGGIYYFKNGDAISQYTYKKETSSVH